MSTTPIGTTTLNPLAAAGAPDATVNADTILAYCASRLNTIDGQIQARFADQTRNNELIKQTGKLQTILRKFPDGMANGDELKTHDDWRGTHLEAGAELKKLFNETTDVSLRNRIAADYRTITGKEMPVEGGRAKDGPVELALDKTMITGQSKQQWDARIEDTKQLQDSVGKQNEMSMIGLQALVSQRQLAVQLTTQLMAAMNEGMKGICGNIRA
jgi:hypothetical protein